MSDFVTALDLTAVAVFAISGALAAAKIWSIDGVVNHKSAYR
jgi:uncharacterized membrane protein YeiH